jgi:hypothetical protein
MADEPTTPRPPGRPRVDEPGTSVSTWLRPSEHDRLIRLANKHETTVSALVRQLLLLKLR